jgi:uncharacterized protein YbgA (DUF1722 family)/uncharacterized protein YbbK (DUF523 family)
MQSSKMVVGISSCLLGEEVRFDGGHKRNDYIIRSLGEFFEFRAFCPEVEIGLGTPREPIRLVESDGAIRCVGVKNPDLDVTDRLRESAQQQRDWHAALCGYILKKDSPSCGMERVKIYRTTMPVREGIGIYAAELQRAFPHLPIEEEGRLGDPVLRENFIQRVFVYARWRREVEASPTLDRLTRFHARHKYTLMSHNQHANRILGRTLAEASKAELDTLVPTYLAEMMRILKIRATRVNHINVLQHIQGYLKKSLDAEDKAELGEALDAYRKGQVPLIVPITLLKHHFRKYPDEYILDSYYMNPYPAELSLRNLI